MILAQKLKNPPSFLFVLHPRMSDNFILFVPPKIFLAGAPMFSDGYLKLGARGKILIRIPKNWCSLKNKGLQSRISLFFSQNHRVL